MGYTGDKNFGGGSVACHFTIFYSKRKLDRSFLSRFKNRKYRCKCRLPGGDQKCGVFYFTGLGFKQCSSNFGWTKSWRKRTGSGRKKCTVNNQIQCNFYGSCYAFLLILFITDHQRFYK